MNKHILVLPGDGIGPEVTVAAIAVLRAVAERWQHHFMFTEGLIGHAAIVETGEPLPEQTQQLARQADAVLLGAVGMPEYDNNPGATVRPEQGLLKLRQLLDVFANIRPITIYPELVEASPLKPEIIQGTDILFFRELVGGLYFGKPRGRSMDGTTAVDTMTYSKAAVRRIAVQAFQAAQQRRRQLCSVDKANVLECSRLWREVVQEVAREYPAVTVTHMYVDNAAMQLVRQPNQFDVILTENMFGDILTDEASQLVGSIGLLPSASIGNHTAVFEPIHGSAPNLVGTNTANPIAAILSAALLLRLACHLDAEASTIERAVAKVISQGYRTVDLAGPTTPTAAVVSTTTMTDYIIKAIQ